MQKKGAYSAHSYDSLRTLLILPFVSSSIFSLARKRTRHATSAAISRSTSHVTNSAASGPLGISAHLCGSGVSRGKGCKCVCWCTLPVLYRIANLLEVDPRSCSKQSDYFGHNGPLGIGAFFYIRKPVCQANKAKVHNKDRPPIV